MGVDCGGMLLKNLTEKDESSNFVSQQLCYAFSVTLHMESVTKFILHSHHITFTYFLFC